MVSANHFKATGVWLKCHCGIRWGPTNCTSFASFLGYNNLDPILQGKSRFRLTTYLALFISKKYNMDITNLETWKLGAVRLELQNVRKFRMWWCIILLKQHKTGAIGQVRHFNQDESGTQKYRAPDAGHPRISNSGWSLWSKVSVEHKNLQQINTATWSNAFSANIRHGQPQIATRQPLSWQVSEVMVSGQETLQSNRTLPVARPHRKGRLCCDPGSIDPKFINILFANPK